LPGLGHVGSQQREQSRMGDQVPLFQARPDLLEDRPQRRALWLRQPGLSPEPGNVAIGLPAVQLPGVDDLLPFRKRGRGKLAKVDNSVAEAYAMCVERHGCPPPLREYTHGREPTAQGLSQRLDRRPMAAVATAAAASFARGRHRTTD